MINIYEVLPDRISLSNYFSRIRFIRVIIVLDLIILLDNILLSKGFIYCSGLPWKRKNKNDCAKIFAEVLIIHHYRVKAAPNSGG